MGNPVGNAIAQLRAEDPIKRISVICGPEAVDDITGLAAPRGSAANVRVLSLNALVSEGAASLQKARLQRSDVHAEVAAFLDPGAAPTVFHEKQLHHSPATLEGLTDAIFSLLTLPEEWRGRHGGDGLPAIVEKMAAQIQKRLSKTHYTYPEAVRATAAAVEPGSVIVVGDLQLDALSEWTLGELGDVHAVTVAHTPAITHATFVAEHDEAKFIAHRIAAAVERGAHLHEIAVGCCDEAQIPFIVQALEEAGISHRAPSTRTWSENAYFRASAQLIRIDPEQMNRRDLAALLETGAVRDAPWIATFDRVTRDNNHQFYSGTDWDREPATGSHGGSRAEQQQEVLDWVHTLRERLHRLWSAASWPSVAAELRNLADDHLREPWGVEAAYLDALADTLEGARGPVSRQRAIDAIGPLYTTAQPAEPGGLVAVGPLESLSGRELHTAFIAGATDTALPGSLTPSATLTPEQTNTTPEQFIARRRRAFDAATSCAEHVYITLPRSHQDGSGKTQPSLWVGGAKEVRHYPSLSKMLLNGDIAPLSDMDKSLIQTAIGEGTEEIARYRDIQEYRAVGAHRPWPDQGTQQPGAEFNGYVRSEAGKRFFEEKSVSNSALEDFTDSPMSFYIQRILGAYKLEDSVNTQAVAPLEGGNIYHAIFERWTNDVLLNADHPPQYKQAAWWADTAKPRLDTIVEEELVRASSARVHPLAWQGFSAQVKRDVEQWYEVERRDLEQQEWRPIAAELHFGRSGREEEPQDTATPEPSFTVDAGDDETATIRFNGSIDRVDYKVEDGSVRLRITDYKSGSGYNRVRGAIHGNSRRKTPYGPTGEQGKKRNFQLALYGYAVHEEFVGGQLHGWFPSIAAAVDGLGPVSVVEARYWYFQEPSEGPLGKDTPGEVLIRIDDSVVATLRTNLSLLYQYVVGGYFPPGEAELDSWVDEKAKRIGRAQYETVVEALTEAGAIPLQFESAPPNQTPHAPEEKQ